MLGIAGADVDGVTGAMSVLLLHIPVSAHKGSVDAVTWSGTHDLYSHALLDNAQRPMEMDVLVPRTH